MRRIYGRIRGVDVAPFALSQTFALHSFPGSNHTIYLDFDGLTLTGDPMWNPYFGLNAIVVPPYSIDGNPSLNDTELTRIQLIWQMVAEDFAPFNVDVTTEEPTIDRLTKANLSDSTYGIRVAIGGSPPTSINVGGLGYVGSFDLSTDTPVFVYTDRLATGEVKATAECISHEVGHSLGLNHDGESGGDGEYYYGRNGWAPIIRISNR